MGDRGGARAVGDHRIEAWTAAILRVLGIVNSLIDRPVGRLEAHFLRHSDGNDPPRFLSHGGVAPTGALSVVGARMEDITCHDGPNLHRHAIRSLRVAQRRDMQIN